MIQKIFHMKYFTGAALCLIFILALIMRFSYLSTFPVGFQTDEASLGYNAYSLLLTGKSESGDVLPLYVSTFGDYNPIGYDYLAIIPVAVFGLNEFSTRSPAALFGALTVFPIFYLSFLLFKNTKISLFSSFLLAISPWHFMLSRGSAETLVALFFVIAGFALIIDSFISSSGRKLILGTVVLSISFFIYPAPRIFVPLFYIVLFLFLSHILHIKWRYKIFASLSFTFLAVLIMGLVFAIPGGTARFKQTSIFNYPETRLVMEEQYREDGSISVPLLFARTFHNKLINYSLTFTSNYLEYFSGSYLFINGGQPLLFKIPNMGLMYIIELPFLLIGIYSIIRSKNKNGLVILLWLICSPVVAAVTVDDSPNIRRSLLMLPALGIITAVGFWQTGIFLLKKKTLKGVHWGNFLIVFLLIFLLFNVSYFFHQYFVHSKTHRTWFRNNGFAEMMEIVNENYSKYDKIVMAKSGGGYPLVLFYSKYNPAVYQQEGSPKDADYKGFGRYIFVPNDCPSINSSVSLPKSTKILFVDLGSCEPPAKFTKKYTDVKRQDGSAGFRIVY